MWTDSFLLDLHSIGLQGYMFCFPTTEPGMNLRAAHEPLLKHPTYPPRIWKFTAEQIRHTLAHVSPPLPCGRPTLPTSHLWRQLGNKGRTLCRHHGRDFLLPHGNSKSHWPQAGLELQNRTSRWFPRRSFCTFGLISACRCRAQFLLTSHAQMIKRWHEQPSFAWHFLKAQHTNSANSWDSANSWPWICQHVDWCPTANVSSKGTSKCFPLWYDSTKWSFLQLLDRLAPSTTRKNKLLHAWRNLKQVFIKAALQLLHLLEVSVQCHGRSNSSSMAKVPVSEVSYPRWKHHNHMHSCRLLPSPPHLYFANRQVNHKGTEPGFVTLHVQTQGTLGSWSLKRLATLRRPRRRRCARNRGWLLRVAFTPATSKQTLLGLDICYVSLRP